MSGMNNWKVLTAGGTDKGAEGENYTDTRRFISTVKAANWMFSCY